MDRCGACTEDAGEKRKIRRTGVKLIFLNDIDLYPGGGTLGEPVAWYFTPCESRVKIMYVLGRP